MKFLVALLIVFISFECSLADPIPFKDCGSTGVVKLLDMSGCSKLPCTFYKGQNYSLNLNFVSNTNTPKAENKVYGIIAGVPVPFPLPQDDACANGISCPLTSGTSYSEVLTLAVLQEYPEISLYVKFVVTDSNSNSLVCVEFPAKIVSSKQQKLDKIKKFNNKH